MLEKDEKEFFIMKSKKQKDHVVYFIKHDGLNRMLRRKTLKEEKRKQSPREKQRSFDIINKLSKLPADYLEVLYRLGKV